MARVYSLITFVGFVFVNIQAAVITRKTDLCIVKNVALNKVAEVSSMHHTHSYASLAVDGDLTQTYLNGGKASCFHTALTGNNWWQVDLGRIYDIERITLFNRQDCCAERARKIDVLVGDTLNNLTKVGFVETMGSHETINLPKTKGRYVKLVQTATEHFHLCEVEVYAVADPCCYSPCQNGGICSTDTYDYKRGYRCTCAFDMLSDYVHTGDNCEETWVKLPLNPTYKLVPRK